MNNYKNLFLRQSYLDAWNEYVHSLSSADAVLWDYVVLTASNENQAQTYRAQLDYRVRGGYLPQSTKYVVLPDPDGKRVGSGGATLNVMAHIARQENTDRFDDLRILVIHSGGDSKRIPQYSACGKIFSPVPRELPDGRCSTIFDEFIIGMSGVPARIPSGMLVASGDVLLLLNALQIDFCTTGAAALSIKEDTETGANHGVYMADAEGNVSRFLHKKSAGTLRELGAADASDKINIDTGAVIVGSQILNDLWQLVQNDLPTYINEQVRLSFYADFLYPMATDSALPGYMLETPEGDFSDALTDCRHRLWDVLRPYRIRLIRLSPASFIHFGTTHEMLRLMNTDLPLYSFLDWKPNIHTNNTSAAYSARNSYIHPNAIVGDGAYIEDSILLEGCRIGKGSIVSGLELRDITVPDNTVLHGLRLTDGAYTVRFYGVADNPKQCERFGKALPQPLWTSALFPVCATMEEACRAVPAGSTAYPLISLQDSFNRADGAHILSWQNTVQEKVCAENILQRVRDRLPFADVTRNLPPELAAHVTDRVADCAQYAEPEERTRIFFTLSQLTGAADKEKLQKKSFREIRENILSETRSDVRIGSPVHICREEANVALPVRVNWGGGWTDTPPYCMDNGGTVLNMAITLGGALPVRTAVRRLDTPQVILSCRDNGAQQTYTELSVLRDLRNPFDQFAIQKSALCALGILPEADVPMRDFLHAIGGGFLFETSVLDIPRGSGLGTSSILAAACVRALSDFFGLSLSDDALYAAVLCMEQLMSTGGGWQDQIGGYVPGLKMIRSAPGLPQRLQIERLRLSEETLRELESRFCLVYTGQRRLARNLLRDVIGQYMLNNPEILHALEKIRTIAEQMREALLAGDVDLFAALLTEHWHYSQVIDAKSTNTCIDHIFSVCEDLIDGRMIAGAGGGGFLQIVLKKGVSKQTLSDRLTEVYADSGVAVWDCAFYL